MLRILQLFFVILYTTYASSSEKQANQLPTDVVLGNENAPVTIIDYSSFTCPTCAHFHNEVLPKLEKKYIETGKAKLIFRSYAARALDLQVSAIPMCASKTKFYTFVKVFFKTQSNWAQDSSSPISTIENIARLGGFSKEEVKECL